MRRGREVGDDGRDDAAGGAGDQERRVAVRLSGGVQVAWTGGAHALLGWWRSEPGWVMTVMGDPAPRPPRWLCDAPTAATAPL